MHQGCAEPEFLNCSEYSSVNTLFVRRSRRVLTVDLVTWCCWGHGCVAGCPWGRADVVWQLERTDVTAISFD